MGNTLSVEGRQHGGSVPDRGAGLTKAAAATAPSPAHAAKGDASQRGSPRAWAVTVRALHTRLKRCST
jgi:hypothetical protein